MVLQLFVQQDLTNGVNDDISALTDILDEGTCLEMLRYTMLGEGACLEMLRYTRLGEGACLDMLRLTRLD